eukprot:SAG31_NODE_34477_length_332_cov_1.111588_1_plen_55_part_10
MYGNQSRTTSERGAAPPQVLLGSQPQMRSDSTAWLPLSGASLPLASSQGIRVAVQ